MIDKKNILCAIILIISFNLSYSQQDFRKAIRGFSYEAFDNGIKITKLNDNSAVIKAGLEVNDVVLSIGGNSLEDYESRGNVLKQLQANKPLVFDIRRNGNALKINIILDPIPKEQHESTIVEYGRFNYLGDNIRTFVTIPKNIENKKYPAVLLVQWLSCGTIEIPGNPADGMDYIIKAFANNSNIIFYRIDKSGVGDSNGTPCNQLDAKREMGAYKKALSELKKRPDVDTSQIYILGLSLGTSLAPIVGENENVAGYMVSGGTSKTWYEHMLEFERNRLTLAGKSPSEINSSLKGYTVFYYQYLIRKKTPEQIIKEHPKYKYLWYDDPRHQFGRSATYYQQIQDLNFEDAWSKVKVPVLALYGEYDWVMSLQDHEMIKELTGDKTQIKVLPKTGHLLSTYPTLKDAFDDEIGKINENAYAEMWSWLQQKLKKE